MNPPGTFPKLNQMQTRETIKNKDLLQMDPVLTISWSSDMFFKNNYHPHSNNFEIL